MTDLSTPELIARLRPKLERALALALIDTSPFVDSGSLADAALGVFTAEIARLEAQVAQLQGELKVVREEVRGLADSLDDHVQQEDVYDALVNLWRSMEPVAALGAATQPEGEDTYHEQYPEVAPPLANRATRRRCQHRSKGNEKDGYYCVDCGTLTGLILSEGEVGA
jgi:hypothetical protein